MRNNVSIDFEIRFICGPSFELETGESWGKIEGRERKGIFMRMMLMISAS